MTPGGKRLGAGRKPDPNKRLVVSYTLPREVVEYLKTLDNKSRELQRLVMRSSGYKRWAKQK